DQALAAAVAAADAPILVGGHLGPHPFLAEAMHARLSEAGLARIGRAGRISIVTAADGVIVGAAGDPEEAIQLAGVVAVLLASRLTIPTVPAPLDDPGALRYAAEQLRAAQVTRVALAPCVVGPEVPAATMASIAASTGLECAPPLGGYPTIGHLVAMRYGAALEAPQLAAVPGCPSSGPAAFVCSLLRSALPRCPAEDASVDGSGLRGEAGDLDHGDPGPAQQGRSPAGREQGRLQPG